MSSEITNLTNSNQHYSLYFIFNFSYVINYSQFVQKLKKWFYDDPSRWESIFNEINLNVSSLNFAILTSKEFDICNPTTISLGIDN